MSIQFNWFRLNINLILLIYYIANFCFIIVTCDNQGTTPTTAKTTTSTTATTAKTTTSVTTTVKATTMATTIATTKTTAVSCFSSHRTATDFYSAILQCTQENGVLNFINMSTPVASEPLGIWFESNRLGFILGPATIWVSVIDTDGTWMYSILTFSYGGNFTEMRLQAYNNATSMTKNSNNFQAWATIAQHNKYTYGCYICPTPATPTAVNRLSNWVWHNGFYYWVTSGLTKSMAEYDVDCGKDKGMLAPINNRFLHAFAVGIQAALNLNYMLNGVQKLYQNYWRYSSGELMNDTYFSQITDVASSPLGTCMEISSLNNYLMLTMDCTTSISAGLCRQSSNYDCKLTNSIKRVGKCFNIASRGSNCSNLQCPLGTTLMSNSDASSYEFNFLNAWSGESQPTLALGTSASVSVQPVSITCGCVASIISSSHYRYIL